ncbi:MAG: hypothetical protein LBC97_09990 [Bifidobacteriaceae bacterium]|nr:hypothetical protein [Bifidobacteriaceae bacterium]
MVRKQTARARHGGRASRFKKAVLAAIALGVSALSAVGGATPALAAEYPSGEWGTYKGASTHWGNILIQGQYGWCADPGTTPPDTLDPAHATKICGQTAGGAPDKTAQIAYLAAMYDKSTDDAVSVSVSQFIRAEYHDSIPVTYRGVHDRLAAEAKRNGGQRQALLQVDADNLTVWYGLVRQGETDRAAAHYADGFKTTLTITTPNATFDGGGTTMTATTGAGVQSARIVPRHTLIADEAVTVTMTVAGVPQPCYLFYQQGSTQRIVTGLTQSLEAKVTGKATQTKWQPKITTETPTKVLDRNATTVQDKVKATAVDGTQWPVKEWADAIQTKPKTYHPQVASGQVVKASTPPAASKTLPAGAVVVSAEPTLVTLTGPDVWATVTTTLPDTGSGHYAMRWCLDPAYQGGNAKYLPKGAATCDDYFAATERYTIPMTLAVSSALPDQYRAKGQAPDDTITVSLPNPTDQWISKTDGNPAVVKAAGTYYAGSASSFVIADQPPADAKPLGTATVDVTLPTTGRDPVTVDAPAGFTVPTSQYGTWVWRIDRSQQADDVKVLFDNDPSDKFGQPGETHVTQMDLVIKSQTEHETVAEPKGDGAVEVCDSVWVEHTSPGDLWLNQWGTDRPVEVLADGKLYHSAVPAAQTTSIDPGIPVVDEYQLTFTAAGQDHAQTVCHTVDYGEYGAYGFVYDIKRDRQPEATKDYLAKDATTPLWLPEETVIIRRTPVVHTSASQWSATNDGTEEVFFTDEVWQTDWPDGPEDSDLHGAVGHTAWGGYGPWEADAKTVTVELWRIEGDVTPESCTVDNPAARLIAVNEKTPAWNTWAARQMVSGSKFKAEGGDATYTFVVSYPGDARTEPYRSVCGEKSETITLVHEQPQFITQTVTEATRKGASVATAQARTEALQVEAGTKITDLLHAWYPTDGRPADTTGWTVVWDVYWQPFDDGQAPGIVAQPSGEAAYQGARCTPETLLASSGRLAPISGEGVYASPEFTMPDKPGLLSLVETVADADGKVIRRGACGLVNETAILLPPPPEEAEPQITTTAPEHAQVGDTITDEALLTGPFPKGTQVEFWYQRTDYINPGAAQDELRCEAPDPDEMDGTVKIGATELDKELGAGETAKFLSPEFTSDQEGCTWIKEIAWSPDSDSPDRAVLAQGRFGTVSERTMWHQPPKPGPSAETGGKALPMTGANTGPWIAIGSVALVLGAALLVGAKLKSRRADRQ